MKLMLFLMISSSICVGLFCASIHERVLAKVTNVFSKIVAFAIGAAGTAWVCGLLLGTYGWTQQSSNWRNKEELIAIWAGFGMMLLAGIVLIGLTTTLADIRENVRRIADQPPAPTPQKRPIQPAVPEVSLATPYPSEPSLTDEEKVQLAKDLVKNAQLKSMPKSIDEETPTEP